MGSVGTIFPLRFGTSHPIVLYDADGLFDLPLEDSDPIPFSVGLWLLTEVPCRFTAVPGLASLLPISTTSSIM